MKHITLFLMIFLIFVFSTNSHALQLTGLMTIDPGTKGEVVVGTDPDTGDPITFIAYTGGSYFAMATNEPNGSAAAMVGPGSAGGIQLGTYQNFILNPDEPHPDGHPLAVNGAGSGYLGIAQESNILAPFPFVGVSTYAAMNPISYQQGTSHLPPTADADGLGNMTADLSSWEVFWNGSVFQQGPRPDNTGPFVPATGTYDSVSGYYTLDWSSQILGGPFSGVTGYWHLEGTVVPEPASLLLLGSGLVGLWGIHRKRMKK